MAREQPIRLVQSLLLLAGPSLSLCSPSLATTCNPFPRTELPDYRQTTHSNPSPDMLASTNRPMENEHPMVSYTRSLHDYTLRLWTESRRLAEEKALQKAALRRQEEERRAAATPAAKMARRVRA